jgi:quinoprotein glucose dehydrogenase
VRRFFLAGTVVCAFAAVSGAVRPATTWSGYLGGAHSSQFTPLDQINLSTVSRLDVAWSFPAGQRSFMFGPLMADGLVFVLAGANDLVALDAATGAKVWSRPHPGAVGTRGLNYWRSADGRDRRLLYIAGGFLTAVDARTGQAVAHSGRRGRWISVPAWPPRADRSTGSPRSRPATPVACSRTS